MAVGDLTTTIVGIFSQQTLIAGMAGATTGGAKSSEDIGTFNFIPLEFGQILVVKTTRAAA